MSPPLAKISPNSDYMFPLNRCTGFYMNISRLEDRKVSPFFRVYHFSNTRNSSPFHDSEDGAGNFWGSPKPPGKSENHTRKIVDHCAPSITGILTNL
jgi:hypothetical protein